jgi:pilus assembly protein Flp/PilA
MIAPPSLQQPIPHAPRRGQRGQGLVEYALIILFVAIAVIAILALLGPVIGRIFSQVTPAL